MPCAYACIDRQLVPDDLAEIGTQFYQEFALSIVARPAAPAPRYDLSIQVWVLWRWETTDELSCGRQLLDSIVQTHTCDSCRDRQVSDGRDNCQHQELIFTWNSCFSRTWFLPYAIGNVLVLGPALVCLGLSFRTDLVGMVAPLSWAYVFLHGPMIPVGHRSFWYTAWQEAPCSLEIGCSFDKNSQLTSASC